MRTREPARLTNRRLDPPRHAAEVDLGSMPRSTVFFVGWMEVGSSDCCVPRMPTTACQRLLIAATQSPTFFLYHHHAVRVQK